MNGEALSTTKVVHDPDQVARERERHSKELNRCKTGWMNDRRPDPSGATAVNDEAVTAYWNDQYDQYVRACSKSRLPVDLQPEALREWIAEHHANVAKAARLETPLHKLDGLEEYEFAVVGECRFGTVWMNTALVVVVAKNGEVFLHIRKYVDLATLMSDLEDDLLEPFIHTINYTARELFVLLQSMKVNAVAAPMEHDIELAKGEEPA